MTLDSSTSWIVGFQIQHGCGQRFVISADDVSGGLVIVNGLEATATCPGCSSSVVVPKPLAPHCDF